MERMTIRTSKGAALIMADGYDSEADARKDLMRRYRVAIDRLAAYEDTGLEPEAVKQLAEDVELRFVNWIEKRYGIGAGRFLDMVNAEKTGRLVVLPCKTGDMVYFALLGRIIEKAVFSIVSFANSQRIYCSGTSEYFRPEDIGKTVFLTRAEAEAALEAQEGDK